MRRFPSIETRKGTFLPEVYWPGHELCFFLHDIMAHMLASGERAGAFHVKFELREGEREQLECCEDIFQWLDQYRKPEERTAVLVAGVFPAILSDMLHCIYEALETSRKAKLNVSYMLLRKPIQENLYLLEAVIADREDFAKKLTEDPIKLWSQGAGGREAHASNIAKVLGSVGDDGRFDANYLAQLRYDKAAEDGFDGLCNKAIHLFTSHKAIATEPMNINFIFSNWASKETQWSFLYTRLPYVLAYAHRIVEAVCSQISPTYPDYLEDIGRRLAAHVIIWGATLGEGYDAEQLLVFVSKHQEWLIAHCKTHGYREPKYRDLVRMTQTGAFPGESRFSVWKRLLKFRIAAELSGSAESTWLHAILRRLGFCKLP